MALKYIFLGAKIAVIIFYPHICSNMIYKFESKVCYAVKTKPISIEFCMTTLLFLRLDINYSLPQ